MDNDSKELQRGIRSGEVHNHYLQNAPCDENLIIEQLFLVNGRVISQCGSGLHVYCVVVHQPHILTFCPQGYLYSLTFLYSTVCNVKAVLQSLNFL